MNEVNGMYISEALGFNKALNKSSFMQRNILTEFVEGTSVRSVCLVYIPS